MSAVADDMDALSPQEIEPGELGLRGLYYELGVLALRDSYKRCWDDFVRSGPADAWHCFRSVISTTPLRILPNGQCERHNEASCLRVMLRREGVVVSTFLLRKTVMRKIACIVQSLEEVGKALYLIIWRNDTGLPCLVASALISAVLHGE